MGSHPLYVIHHMDLKEFLGNPLDFHSSCRQYLVFWWMEYPLGDLYLEDPGPLYRETVWRTMIWEAIKPAISFYALEKKMETGTIGEIFLHHSSIEILEVFDALFLRSNENEKSLPSVSLVLCTRNRAKFLENALQSLVRLRHKPLEIIVVDNCPDDKATEEVVTGYPGVKYVKEIRKGLNFARNCGIHTAIGEIIAFTDDDVDLHPDWILRVAQGFKDPRIQAVTGLVFAKSLDTPAQYYFEKNWGFNRGYTPVFYCPEWYGQKAPTGVPVWEIGAGASMAFRRKIFNALGDFDIRLDAGAAGCNGDSEMWYRILVEGWTVKYDPLVIAYHTHRREINDFKKQILLYIRGQVTSILIEFRRYRNQGERIHLFRVLPLYYLKRLKHPFHQENKVWFQEITGYLEGLIYYRTHCQKPPFELEFQQPFPCSILEDSPLITVIITTYNHSRFLPEALESVLNQTYKPIQCIVVDDGSTDDTQDILKQYAQVTCIRQKNQGLASARNLGLTLAKGNYIVFLDADDWLYPDGVAVQYRFFKHHPEAAFVAGSHDKVDSLKTILSLPEAGLPEDPYVALLQGNFIGMHASVMYRREVFDQFLFDIRLTACEDYDIYLRISRAYKISVHSRKIAAYRMHGQNMSANSELMLGQIRAVLKKHYSTLPIQRQFPYYRKGLRAWKSYYANEAGLRFSQIQDHSVNKGASEIPNPVPAPILEK